MSSAGHMLVVALGPLRVDKDLSKHKDLILNHGS